MDIKKFLSNTQMGRVVANFLNIDTLATNEQGQVALTAEEEQKLTQQFGASFVGILKAKTFTSAEDNATELFEAASAHIRDTATAPLVAQVTQLQGDVATLAATSEEEPAREQAGAPAPKSTSGFKANMQLAHNATAASFLQSGGKLAADPTIEVADVKKELGPYLSQGNNLDVLQALYNGFTTSQHLTWKRAVTEFKAVLADAIGSVVQQFTKGWNPKGGAKFTPLTIKNYRHKVDYAIDPADVGESWLFHLYDEKLTPDQMPITRYIIDKVLLPKIANDLELVMTGKAEYKADSKETEETMNGIETQLVAAKKSLDKHINFFKTDKNLREASDDEVLKIIDDFVASIAPLYKSQKLPVFLSGDVYLKYKRAYKNKWGAGSGTEKTDFGTDRVDFSTCYLQVLDCLHGSPIVFSTPKENFIGLQHKNAPQFITDIQKHDREVRIYMEFWYGVGFLIGEAVFAIVPDGYVPKEAISSTRVGSPDKWITEGEGAAAEDGGDDSL